MNRFFDKRDSRYNYQFIKEYNKTWYFNNNPQHSNQVPAFGDAIRNSRNGTYMYVEKNMYIPYRIHNGMITFNRGDPIDIKSIRPQLNQNRSINTNTFNKLAKKEYECLGSYRQSMFIDPVSYAYRREFMINYKRTIPQHFWEKSSFDNLFDNHNNLSNFMLLDNSCEYGAPVGIDKESKLIILNDNTRMSWSEFKNKMYNNDIIKYQNLDFKRNNYLLTLDTIDNNFKPPVQQIANVDLKKFSKSTILSYFIGQFVLLDYGTEHFMPIYLYSQRIIRSSQHIIMLEDIERYIQQNPNTRFNKNEVIPNNCYVNITVENVARPNGWLSRQITSNRPQLDDIPQGILNGLMTNDQSESVTNAINNAINHTSDRQQFRKKNDKHHQPSRSVDNSPNLQPQPQQQVQIIPIISVSQLPINQKQPVSPDAHVEEERILSMMEHDRISILFPKLSHRLQQYFTKNHNEMAIHFMNYDHNQIIAALNDETILRELAQHINQELENYNKKSLASRMETSIWNDKIICMNMDDLIVIDKDKLQNELNLFNESFQKTEYLINFITSNVRRIDHLRVNQIMHLVKGNNRS